MLEDFLSEIYDRAMTLELLKEASFYSCFRHVDFSRKRWNEASSYIEKIINDLRESDVKRGTELVNASFKAQQCYNNWHNFSAAIDSEVVPKVLDYLKQYTGINVTEGEWTLESSSTGFITIRNSRYGYVHSPFDPMWESFLYAKSIYDPEVNCYFILGGGLGYLPYQLWRMTSGEADIYVFEIDEEMNRYADLYGVMSLIDESKIHVVSGDDTDIILEKFTEDIPDTTILRTVYHWDASNYNGVYADYFNILLASEVTTRIFADKWKSNFEWNSKLEHGYFSDLDPSSFKDEWIVVGSGPSLNDNEEFIRESVGKRTICCVNSSFKWFYLHNIKPDLCTVCDPTDLLVPHIEGYEHYSTDVPIVADSIANRKYMELYEGPKFFVYSSAAAMTVGKDNVIGDVWNIGGTVTSMAMETAFKLGARKVYLIGADLAYPGRVTFADGVGHDVEKWNGTEETVVSVEDTIIPTSLQFTQYRSMMEAQIEGHPETEVINKSLHGAYLKGTFCNKWWENIPQSALSKDYLDLFEELKKDTNLLNWKNKYYIFWQILEKFESSCKFTSDEGLVVKNAYRSIYEEFRREMNYQLPADGYKNSNLTYIFTVDFKDEKDPDSREILKLAKTESTNKRNVLIVNTTERLGGEKVPMHDCIPAQYNSALETSETVPYGKNSFSYFQFSKGMPDLEYYKVFLDSVSGSRPGRIIISSKYSLLADLCAELLDAEIVKQVEYEQKN